MTRLELLHLVVGRARANGFPLRRWYTHHLGLPWISMEATLALLDMQRRYYALIFSHEFAQSFWKPGSEISFDVPAQTYARPMPDGTVRLIQRKPFVRRSVRPNAWRYHLREMALAEEPLRYLRKYLHLAEEEGNEMLRVPLPESHPQASASKLPTRRGARPLPDKSPAFLDRPYRAAKK